MTEKVILKLPNRRDQSKVTASMSAPVTLVPEQSGGKDELHRAKANMINTGAQLVHKSHAVLVFIAGLMCGVFLVLTVIKSTIPIGGDLMERGTMIGRVFGSDSSEEVPGDPRSLRK